MYEILEKYKTAIGFGNYNITISKNYEDIDCYMNVEPSMYLQTLYITLGTILKQETDRFIKETLIHELVHARFRLYELRYEDMKEQEEELFVNDVVNVITKVEKC